VQANPIIVRFLQDPPKETTIVDVVVGSLGLTGALLLAAIILGAILGGILIGIQKLRARYNLERVPDSESLRITPQG
jgi:hypothetical protein